MKVNLNNLVLVLGCFMLTPVFASGNSTPAAAENREPSLEFLMYLGEWQDNSGQSINPGNYKDEKTVLTSMQKNTKTENNFTKEKTIESQSNLENTNLKAEKKQ